MGCNVSLLLRTFCIFPSFPLTGNILSRNKPIHSLLLPFLSGSSTISTRQSWCPPTGNQRLTRNLALFFFTAFLTAVLQDYGRAQGISMDTLTFSHKVIHRTSTVQEDEFSKLLQKRLNIVRRAFQVLGAEVTRKGPVSIL